MQYSNAVYERARRHFADLVLSLGNPAGSKEVFKRLLSCYSEPHRSYHTLKHIVSMLDEFETVCYLADDQCAVCASIWFHDAVYDTHPHDHSTLSNEERSALLAEEQLKSLSLPEEFILRVRQHILATRHTEVVDNVDVDTQLLLDLDLAILGKPEEEFDQFDYSIKKEYAWVPEDNYKRERAKILRMFLGREKLFGIPFFATTYDQQARENLKRAITRLES